LPSKIKIFDNINPGLINGDHYMARDALGINEQFITGNGSDKDKFMNWAKLSCIPVNLYIIGSHLTGSSLF
jgi:glucuronate isomerase